MIIKFGIFLVRVYLPTVIPSITYPQKEESHYKFLIKLSSTHQCQLTCSLFKCRIILCLHCTLVSAYGIMKIISR